MLLVRAAIDTAYAKPAQSHRGQCSDNNRKHRWGIYSPCSRTAHCTPNDSISNIKVCGLLSYKDNVAVGIRTGDVKVCHRKVWVVLDLLESVIQAWVSVVPTSEVMSTSVLAECTVSTYPDASRPQVG